MKSSNPVWLKLMPSTIIKDLKVWFLYHCLAIRNRLIGCWLCSPWTISLVLSFKDCFCEGRLLMFVHIFYRKTSDPRALSLKADEIYQSHVSSSVNILFTEEPLESQSINIVRGASSAGRTSHSSVSSASSSAASWRTASSLWWYHRCHGDKAQNCRQPCSWSGN